jgi:hypothetical protein
LAPARKGLPYPYNNQWGLIMAGIFSRLIDFMEEEEWKYEILEGESVLRFHFKGSAGRLLCYADVEEEKDWLIFYSYLPVNTPTDKMATMAEFITRANRGMRIGNFELDFEDGEIRYKTSIDIEGGELTSKMIDNLLRANLSTMNRYFPGMMELIYSDKSPKEAIQKIEGAEDTEEASHEDGDEHEDFGLGEFHPDATDEDEEEPEGEDKRRLG